MNTKLMKITPEIAKEMLERNTKNRKVSMIRVLVYADDMARGGWQVNGEAICFNKSGQLINGQHRLMAIVKSGCTVEMVVVTGIEDDVTIYDRGRNRSASDALTLSGMYSTSYTVAIARLYLYENGGAKQSFYSESKIKQFHIDHAESLREVIDEIVGKSTKGVNTRTAYFMTAILKAYENGVPKNTLKKFVQIVRTGFYEGENQSAAVIIRNDIISGALHGRSIAQSEQSSYMVENAIKDFAAGYVRKKTYKNTTTRVYEKRVGDAD